MTLTANEPSGTVRGELVQVCIDGVMSVYQSRMRNMLDEEGIEKPDPEPDEWYPLANFLEVLRTVEENTGESALAKIGESTPRFLDWSRIIDSPHEGLDHLPEMYEAEHRQVAGQYTYEKVDETHARITSTTPYPAQWEKGFLKGTAQHFGAEHAHADIDDDGPETTFEVRW
ncbi:hypothetical protein [Halovenus salina]|uniref:Uncharacterized protein n=1 Tax=Halovenus salina TaxID=1510225 RepID=A0ABD5W1Z4_9EURY|nr:hypothetical protein [Halovenus salina]